MTLQNRVATVTGAGGGFGEGIAKHFAALGAKVLVADIRGDEARRVADDITRAGGQAADATVDVTKDADMAAMVARVLERFGTLDIVINDAGTTHKNQPMLNVDEETFDRVYNTNVKSLYLSARHTASTAGVRPRPGLTWYNGSKPPLTPDLGGTANTEALGIAIAEAVARP